MRDGSNPRATAPQLSSGTTATPLPSPRQASARGSGPLSRHLPPTKVAHPGCCGIVYRMDLSGLLIMLVGAAILFCMRGMRRFSARSSRSWSASTFPGSCRGSPGFPTSMGRRPERPQSRSGPWSGSVRLSEARSSPLDDSAMRHSGRRHQREAPATPSRAERPPDTAENRDSPGGADTGRSDRRGPQSRLEIERPDDLLASPAFGRREPGRLCDALRGSVGAVNVGGERHQPQLLV